MVKRRRSCTCQCIDELGRRVVICCARADSRRSATQNRGGEPLSAVARLLDRLALDPAVGVARRLQHEVTNIADAPYPSQCARHPFAFDGDRHSVALIRHGESVQVNFDGRPVAMGKASISATEVVDEDVAAHGFEPPVAMTDLAVAVEPLEDSQVHHLLPVFQAARWVVQFSVHALRPSTDDRVGLPGRGGKRTGQGALMCDLLSPLHVDEVVKEPARNWPGLIRGVGRRHEDLRSGGGRADGTG